MNQTKLMKCVCKSSYQDDVYGGKRLHNKANSKVSEYRCTVCGKLNKDSK
jgi:hypothetical protein